MFRGMEVSIRGNYASCAYHHGLYPMLSCSLPPLLFLFQRARGGFFFFGWDVHPPVSCLYAHHICWGWHSRSSWLLLLCLFPPASSAFGILLLPSLSDAKDLQQSMAPSLVFISMNTVNVASVPQAAFKFVLTSVTFSPSHQPAPSVFVFVIVVAALKDALSA